MAFYAFRFDKIHSIFQRAKVNDHDLVTFGVFVNHIDRGHGSGDFGLLGSGDVVLAAARPPNILSHMSTAWIIGPLEIAPGDDVLVVYSGTNISDLQGLKAQEQAEIQLKIMDMLATAAVGYAGGVVGSVLGAALGLVSDPIGTLLGYHKQYPCNGVVFSDAVQFTGASLEGLPFQSPSPASSFPTLPTATEVSFTNPNRIGPYTDEAAHDTDTCGHIAETDVTFSVLRLASISVRYYTNRAFAGKDFSKGLRQLGTPRTTMSVRRLLGLRP